MEQCFVKKNQNCIVNVYNVINKNDLYQNMLFSKISYVHLEGWTVIYQGVEKSWGDEAETMSKSISLKNYLN